MAVCSSVAHLRCRLSDCEGVEDRLFGFFANFDGIVCDTMSAERDEAMHTNWTGIRATNVGLTVCDW